MKILYRRGVSLRCLNLMRNLYNNQEGYIGGYENLPVEIGRGVRQGCVLSPSLYNTYADGAFKTLKKGEGVSIRDLKINRIMYADDTALLAHTEKELNDLLEELHELGQVFDVDINIKKTQCTKVIKAETEKTAIKFNGNRVEYSSEVKY